VFVCVHQVPHDLLFIEAALMYDIDIYLFLHV